MKTHNNGIRRFVSLGAVAALCFAATSLTGIAADDSTTPAENHGQLTAKDYKFVTEATQGGNMEVTLGQLAAQKGADPSVRDFGQRMVQDHSKANQELKDLVGQKGATQPMPSTKKTEKMAEELQALSGHDFDKTYIKHMVSGHKDTIKLFQKEVDKGDDADLKNWAAKTLPTIQEHLRLAESAETAVTAAAKTPATP